MVSLLMDGTCYTGSTLSPGNYNIMLQNVDTEHITWLWLGKDSYLGYIL